MLHIRVASLMVHTGPHHAVAGARSHCDRLADYKQLPSLPVCINEILAFVVVATYLNNITYDHQRNHHGNASPLSYIPCQLKHREYAVPGGVVGQ